MSFPKLFIVAWLALICALAPAQAEKRVALVVGNDRYANLSAGEQLQKAVNDARAVGRALKQIGFDVIESENLGRQALIDRLDEASQRLAPGDTVFFFFAGHGVAVDGVNYLLPADVPAVGTGQITRMTGAALAEDAITAAFKRAGARVAVMVIDACRNNPFGASGTRGVGGERGLQPQPPPSGVFTLYSAGRGEAALDRLSDGDRNPDSVFTRVLLPALTRPDLDLPGLAVEVREEVTRLAESVGHAQSPAYYDETRGGRIFLVNAGKPAFAPVEAPAAGTGRLLHMAENNVPVAMVEITRTLRYTEIRLEPQMPRPHVCWSLSGPNSPYLLAAGVRYRFLEGHEITSCPIRRGYAAHESMVLRFEPLPPQVRVFSLVEGEGGEHQIADPASYRGEYWNFLNVGLN